MEGRQIYIFYFIFYYLGHPLATGTSLAPTGKDPSTTLPWHLISNVQPTTKKDDHSLKC
jgi:hypothetical protein